MAIRLAKNLAKTLKLDEDIYATDVTFSSNGGTILAITANANKDTSIRQYEAINKYKAKNANVNSSFAQNNFNPLRQPDADGFIPVNYDEDYLVMNSAGTERDVSYTDLTNGYPFHALQDVFSFQNGVSDMYQFVIDISNAGGGTTDEDLIEAVDASANATGGKMDITAYSQGVSAFATGLAPDVSSATTNLTEKTGLADAMLFNYGQGNKSATKVRAQFSRLFLKDDGKKVFILYKNKFRTKGWGSGSSYPYAIRQIDLVKANTFDGTTDLNAQSNHKDDVLVYDVSVNFDPTQGQAGSIVRANANTGLYSQVDDGSVRDIMGFHISKKGNKVFFLTRRGKRNDLDTESISTECSYFAEVSEFTLANNWDISKNDTHVKTIKYYGNKSASTAAGSINSMPIDIDFSANGKKINILAAEGKDQYIYTYDLDKAFSLDNINSLSLDNNPSRFKLKQYMSSFSSVNNASDGLVNVAGVGLSQAMTNTLKNASVAKGNSFVINDSILLDKDTLAAIARRELMHVIEFVKPKSTNSDNNFYPLPDGAKIVINSPSSNGGAAGAALQRSSNVKATSNFKLISALQQSDTITFNDITFTFVARLTKESDQGSLTALVFYPSCKFSVDIIDAPFDKINLQPLTGPVQSELQFLGIQIPGQDNY